jgi:hypothetical protein
MKTSTNKKCYPLSRHPIRCQSRSKKQNSGSFPHRLPHSQFDLLRSPPLPIVLLPSALNSRKPYVLLNSPYIYHTLPSHIHTRTNIHMPKTLFKVATRLIPINPSSSEVTSDSEHASSEIQSDSKLSPPPSYRSTPPPPLQPARWKVPSPPASDHRPIFKGLRRILGWCLPRARVYLYYYLMCVPSPTPHIIFITQAVLPYQDPGNSLLGIGIMLTAQIDRGCGSPRH